MERGGGGTGWGAAQEAPQDSFSADGLEIFRASANELGEDPRLAITRSGTLASSQRGPSFPWFYGIKPQDCWDFFKLFGGFMSLLGWVRILAGTWVVLVSSFQLPFLFLSDPSQRLDLQLGVLCLDSTGRCTSHC